jgi:Ca-activated chloride channel family protein
MALGFWLSVAAAAQFATGVDLVEVYATVTTIHGQPVTGLGRQDFIVREDGVERPIRVFAAGDFPLSVALALDRSWSMAGDRLRLAVSAAHVFLRELRQEDEAMVIAVSDEVETVAPLSNDRAAQHAAIDGLVPWGTTALHDAIIEAVDRIAASSGRRALIVLSDGNDRYSRATVADVLDRVRRNDVLIYPIALGDRVALFSQLAALSGGRAFSARKPADLTKIFSEIAGELRQQYLLGYEPSRNLAGQWHAIEVDMTKPGMRVRARPGYRTH